MKRQLIICNTTELVRLYADDIVYIKADRNYSIFYLVGGEERNVLIQLGETEAMMNTQVGGGIFIRIGRSLIINRNYILFICPKLQTLLLRDPYNHKHMKLKASDESLRKLKELIESEITNQEDNGQETV